MKRYKQYSEKYVYRWPVASLGANRTENIVS